MEKNGKVAHWRFSHLSLLIEKVLVLPFKSHYVNHAWLLLLQKDTDIFQHSILFSRIILEDFYKKATQTLLN